MADETVRDLVRTRDGLIVHRKDCPSLTGGVCSTAVPWKWADERPLSEVRHAVGMVGSRQCRRCNPLGGENQVEIRLILLADARVRVETSQRGMDLESYARSIRGAEREVTGELLKRGYRAASAWRQVEDRGVVVSAMRYFEVARG